MLSFVDVCLWSLRLPDGTIDVPNFTIRNAMTRDVVTCRPEASVNDVARLMIDRKIDAIPVAKSDGSLAGIITSTDLLALAWDHVRGGAAPRIPFDFRVRRDQSEPRSGSVK